MQIATKVITGLGAILTVVALGWLLTGAFEYFSGRKNQNPQQMDQGMTSMISGGALTVLIPGITAAIVSALGAISF